MNYTILLKQIQEYINSYYEEHKNDELIYHNIEHTNKVVKAAEDISAYFNLKDEEIFIVLASSWFHDIGYFTDPKFHEQISADKAEEFLKQHEVPNTVILSVRNCITSTKIPQQPTNLLEEIVCDADLYHLGTNDFDEINKMLRRECNLRFTTKISKNTWRKATILLMEQHEYHTAYCRKLLNEGKKANLEKLRMKEMSEEILKSENLNDNKKDKPSRGIETMFRITSNNHQRLSDMADNKAHIMITTTSIIISVLLTVLLRKLEEYPHLTIPTLILLIICVITMVFSILATRPSIPDGTFTSEDIQNKKTNLLFFGNFYSMPLKEYKEGMEVMMNDSQFLYGSMIQDIYSQGVVLGRKYKLLRVAYNVFMFGIIVSVIGFIIASLLFNR